MDSPGHSAQYCSYTFMENETKKVLCLITMDKRMTERKSTNLEKACFIKGLTFLLGKNIRVVEVVTDAHVQIEAVMSKLLSNLFIFIFFISILPLFIYTILVILMVDLGLFTILTVTPVYTG